MKSKQYIIAFLGEKGSGKGTTIDFLEKIIKSKSISRIRFSDALRQVSNLYDIPMTRSNLQNLAIFLTKYFGDDTISRPVKNSINQALKNGAKYIFVDGMRWDSDYDLIRSYKNSKIIHISTPKEIRYIRLANRNENAGEKNMSYKQFSKEEKRKNELNILKLAKKADIVIDNSGTKEELVLEIKKKIIPLFK